MTKGETVCAIAPEYADFKYIKLNKQTLSDDFIALTRLKENGMWLTLPAAH